MFPLLAYFASQALPDRRPDQNAPGHLHGCRCNLAPLVLVTGSRQGLLLGLLAIALSLIFERPQASLARRRGQRVSV
jgi:hypothetical protein